MLLFIKMNSNISEFLSHLHLINWERLKLRRQKVQMPIWTPASCDRGRRQLAGQSLISIESTQRFFCGWSWYHANDRRQKNVQWSSIWGKIFRNLLMWVVHRRSDKQMVSPVLISKGDISTVKDVSQRNLSRSTPTARVGLSHDTFSFVHKGTAN